MSPRRSAVDTRHTRERIIEHGVALASTEGLDGLTIGRLATELGMSKAGVLGHFGTKEGLQLAVVDAAAALFTREVPERARPAPPGLPRLRSVCEAWIAYLERDILPGGDFFTAAASEFDGRGGPVRDAIKGLTELWHRDVRLHIQLAISEGELPAGTDTDQLLHDLVGVMLALNLFRQLHEVPQAGARARHAVNALLG
ncbi:TetR/AcrR family transcriptional regulator [Amycolatopsis sp. WQ 127309]|uniref:TetR/AcrR family transcriptional regulator n=1 Tax=Amycolatopsis sp. WQ 127309 TaxID=2932773 RepID=UPI001FF6E4AF|nr:TetR/AcrR family transcriptional regulator [Amycolatopsis sp. WQ 127309]UOZ06244.1 TetR/AcrR family transcriptional regulator [Amycolatopsis sp. WQ 127309]